MKRTKFKAIKCELCGGKFLRITNTHLWKAHCITVEEYREKFPDAPIDAKGLAYSRVSHLRNKSYEEVYGESKAEEIRTTRSHDAQEQMKNPEQIRIRKEKCGYEITEEHKEILRQIQTVHGGFTYRKRALEHYGLKCVRCGKTTENPKDFIVHHKDFENINTELGNHSLENLVVLCRSCHAKLYNEIEKQTGRFVGISSVEKGVHYILKGLKDELGLDLTDENFKDTPKRIARAYAEIFSGIRDTQQQVEEILNSAFPAESDQLILVKNIEVFSMCPHHLLPVSYKIHTGYIPSREEGRVLGISKLSRLTEILSKRPVLQEQLVEDITKNLMTLPGCLGAACVAEGIHYCMVMRGVKQAHAKTITSSMKGIFLDGSGQGQAARSELMGLIR